MSKYNIFEEGIKDLPFFLRVRYKCSYLLTKIKLNWDNFLWWLKRMHHWKGYCVLYKKEINRLDECYTCSVSNWATKCEHWKRGIK